VITDECPRTPDWDAPDDLWCVKTQQVPKPGQHGHDMKQEFFFSREDVLKKLRSIEQHTYEAFDAAVWHLDEGFWVPMRFGYYLEPSGEGT
jgi:hypothetical protein